MDKIRKIGDIFTGILAVFLVIASAVSGNVLAALGWGAVLILFFRVVFLERRYNDIS